MKSRRFILTLALLTLGACSTTRSLQSASADPTVTGSVTHGLFEPGRIAATLGGKTYRGEWQVDWPTPAQRGETRYPHRRHIGSVKQTLVADDNSTAQCQWQTHANTAEGICSADGRDYPLTLR